MPSLAAADLEVPSLAQVIQWRGTDMKRQFALLLSSRSTTAIPADEDMKRREVVALKAASPEEYQLWREAFMKPVTARVKTRFGVATRLVRRPTPVVLDERVGAARKEVRDDLLLPMECSAMQRRLVLPVRVLQFGAVAHEEADAAERAGAARAHERGVPARREDGRVGEAQSARFARQPLPCGRAGRTRTRRPEALR